MMCSAVRVSVSSCIHFHHSLLSHSSHCKVRLASRYLWKERPDIPIRKSWIHCIGGDGAGPSDVGLRLRLPLPASRVLVGIPSVGDGLAAAGIKIAAEGVIRGVSQVSRGH